MKKIIILSSLIVASCGNNSVNLKELEIDADRLCAVVQSSPKFQAREEYVKGYYKILDKYDLSQESIFIQETFDEMSNVLFITGICKLKTLEILKYAIEKTDYQTVQNRLNEERAIAKELEVTEKEKEITDLRELGRKKRQEAKMLIEYRKSLETLGEVIINDSAIEKVGFKIDYFNEDGFEDIVVETSDGIYYPWNLGNGFRGVTLESANDKMAVFVDDETGKKFVITK